VKKGISGSQEIAQMMIDLRENPLKEINGEKVTLICDYQSSKAFHPLTGKVEEIDVPKSNVLIYHTDKGTRIAARPSGTEPKIKFYFSVNTTLSGLEAFEETQKVLDAKIKKIVEELKLQ
jgi:phosphoglucomutase/phosphomannomutase alpha/beta/alpha domain I